MTREKRIEIVTPFIEEYNAKWNESWQIELGAHDDFLYVCRYNNPTCDGHFMREFLTFLEEHAIGSCVTTLHSNNDIAVAL